MILQYNITDIKNMLPWHKLKRQKNKIRETVGQRRRILDKHEAAQKSADIVSLIATLPEFVSAKRVMLYYPIHKEVDLMALTEMFDSEKEFYLPVTHRKRIELRRYRHGDKLHRGRFGIPEPQGSSYRGSIDAILVPGVAFDRHLRRLGRGGGYYDRFLKRFNSTVKIGVGYDFQLLTDIPHNFRDKRMNLVVTDKEIVRIDKEIIR